MLIECLVQCPAEHRSFTLNTTTTMVMEKQHRFTKIMPSVFHFLSLASDGVETGD